MLINYSCAPCLNINHCKGAQTALYSPLYHLFLLCLSQHHFSSAWHEHLIVPVFKSGDRSLVKNNRPISLLCSGTYISMDISVYYILTVPAQSTITRSTTHCHLLMLYIHIFPSFCAVYSHNNTQMAAIAPGP